MVEDVPLLFLISPLNFLVSYVLTGGSQKYTFMRSKLRKFWIRTLWAAPRLKTFNFHYYPILMLLS